MADVRDHAADTAPEGAQLRVSRATDGAGAVVLTVTGEIDLSTVDALHSEIDDALGDGADGLVFDMAGVTFMDSSGIAALLRSVGRAGRVELRNPTGTVRRIIELTGLAGILPMTP